MFYPLTTSIINVVRKQAQNLILFRLFLRLAQFFRSSMDQSSFTLESHYHFMASVSTMVSAEYLIASSLGMHCVDMLWGLNLNCV